MSWSIKLGVSAFIVVLILLQSESSTARVLTSNDADGIWDPVMVILINDIDVELTLHVKSKDDDLGIHVLRKGDSWQFSFRPNFFGNTLFYSSFEWDGQLHYFDMYRGDFYGNQFRWRVTTTGLCLIIDGGRCEPWNS